MREDTLRKLVSFFFRYLWVVFGSLLCVNLLNLFVTTTAIMETSAREKLASLSGELASTVASHYKLLNGLTTFPGIADTSIPVEDRAWALRPYAQSFGVWMLGVVDTDGHIAGTRSYSYAKVQRDYIPRIVASKQQEMTNAFPSGETGESNFTQLVPVLRDGEVVTIVFAATRLSDLKAVLTRSNADSMGYYYLADSTLTLGIFPDHGLEGQNIEDLSKNEKVFGSMTREAMLDDLRAGRSNSYYSILDNAIYFTTYMLVPGTTWRLAHRVQVSTVVQTALTGFAVQVLLYGLVLIVLMFVWYRYIQKAIAPMDNILKQVIDLNRMVYNSDTCTDEETAALLYISRRGLKDELTDLPTRMLFRQMLNEHLQKMSTNALCALFYIDMDNLKRINDTLGHDCGDVALKDFGESVRQVAANHISLCSRYGGDEFLLFVEYLESEDMATDIARELLLKLRGTVEKGNRRMEYHSSIGVALYPLHGNHIDVVIQLADIAMYKAKQSGKNRFVLYSDTDMEAEEA